MKDEGKRMKDELLKKLHGYGPAQKLIGAKLRIALIHILYGKCPIPLGLLQTNYVN
jgi:hypothetical protein